VSAASGLSAPREFVATSHHDIGILLVREGDAGRARGHFERALAIRETKLGPDHPATAETLALLADLYRDSGELARAEPLYLRALEIREAKLGSDHPDTARTLREYARMLELASRDAEAAELRSRLSTN